MTEKEKRSEADLGSAPLKDKSEEQSYNSLQFPPTKSSRLSNAFVVKNSRYMKRDDRDPRMLKSVLHDDYVVSKEHADLIEKLEKTYVLTETYDPIVDEAPEIQKLTSLLIWKKEQLAKATKELLKVSSQFGHTVEEAKYSTNPDICDLWDLADQLRREAADIDEQIKHIKGREAQDERPSQDKTAKSGLITLTHGELLRRAIPPRELVLSPWIPASGIAMMFAPPGIGKSNLALSIALTVAAGGTLFNWQAPKARKVFFVDGEMHEGDLQSRVKKLCRGLHEDLCSNNLRYLNGSWLAKDQNMPDLSTREGQRMLEESLGNTEFLILDNLSTLCRSGKENEVSSWLPVQNWLLSLRWKGIAVLLVHHSGKAKDDGGNYVQRGSSAREIVIESTLMLKRPKRYSAEQGCVFEGHFLKNRGFSGPQAAPFEMTLQSDSSQSVWEHKCLEAKTYDRVVDLYNDGIKESREIATELDISRQAVEKHIKRAKKEGDIH
jgi:putative DNA primase/helicase